ncbi:hypothetical protein DICPUDRAFT_157357 [Dictyostelium purpureum]|uniref:CHCH domain-containing protein n=1 Tax=Dictyostelium purpureum TaxID=5786 RepID=F0ZYX6_DICPU|nr:uncharacterized protein DICPUDRAFT_157357 [Dictyostelium purpureum]EGC30856.1 hypothetical protein DICPUDRAFT_157357 [Dictyostelium purpureum]|eukprot:XP_003292622.1 hypothetical protein DICPUDRAFT_157357 [Dictyostelium purpureum]
MATPESKVKEEYGSPCQGIKDNLAECVRNSECMAKGLTFHECIKSKDLDSECKELLYALFKCRKDMYDPRNRFRGNVASMAYNKELSEKKMKQQKEESEKKDNNDSSKTNSNSNNENN